MYVRTYIYIGTYLTVLLCFSFAYSIVLLSFSLHVITVRDSLEIRSYVFIIKYSYICAYIYTYIHTYIRIKIQIAREGQRPP